MWVAAETHLFGFVIKTIFQLTFHNYVSAFNSTLLHFWPKNMAVRLHDSDCSSKKNPDQNQMGTHMSRVTSQLWGLWKVLSQTLVQTSSVTFWPQILQRLGRHSRAWCINATMSVIVVGKVTWACNAICSWIILWALRRFCMKMYFAVNISRQLSARIKAAIYSSKEWF